MACALQSGAGGGVRTLSAMKEPEDPRSSLPVPPATTPSERWRAVVGGGARFILHAACMSPTLTTTQAAACLGIHPQTLRQLIRAGKIPAYRIRRQFRLRSADLTAFIARTGAVL